MLSILVEAEAILLGIVAASSYKLIKESDASAGLLIPSSMGIMGFEASWARF